MPVRLFVGNLPYSATEAEIRELFSAVGPVSSVRLPVDRETGRPRGFAFVEFADRAHAEEAIRRFHNQNMGGRPISVNEARPQERGSGPPQRRDGPGGGFSGPRPGGFGGGPPAGDRGPRPGGFSPSGGGYGGPRPGGFDRPRPQFDDSGSEGPADFDDPNARRRNFGPDALPKRARKNKAKGGKGDRDRAPKGPLSVRGGGRFFSAADDEEEDLTEGFEELEDDVEDEAEDGEDEDDGVVDEPTEG